MRKGAQIITVSLTKMKNVGKRGLNLSLNKIKTIFRYVGEEKLNILVILAWVAVLSFLSIFRYVSFYATETHYIYIDHVKLVTPYSSFEGPSFKDIDLAILFLSGLICGLVLKGLEEILFGLMKALFLWFLTGLVYGSFYIWFILGFKEFALVNFSVAFESAVFYALLNFVRIVPVLLIPCIAGGIIAGLLMGVT